MSDVQTSKLPLRSIAERLQQKIDNPAYGDAADVSVSLLREAVAALREREQPEDTMEPGALHRLLKLHRPYGIYDECGHDHEPDEPGVVNADEIGFTCAKVYDICRECCTNESGQTEECAMSHDHGPGKPICKTAELLSTVHGAEQSLCAVCKEKPASVCGLCHTEELGRTSQANGEAEKYRAALEAVLGVSEGDDWGPGIESWLEVSRIANEALGRE